MKFFRKVNYFTKKEQHPFEIGVMYKVSSLY